MKYVKVACMHGVASSVAHGYLVSLPVCPSASCHVGFLTGSRLGLHARFSGHGVMSRLTDSTGMHGWEGASGLRWFHCLFACCCT